jgi:hypothetical protein
VSTSVSACFHWERVVGLNVVFAFEQDVKQPGVGPIQNLAKKLQVSQAIRGLV